MEILKYSDLLNKDVKELVAVRNSLKSELFNLRMKNSVKWLKQTHSINLAKKNIAKINTAITEIQKKN